MIRLTEVAERHIYHFAEVNRGSNADSWPGEQNSLPIMSAVDNERGTAYAKLTNNLLTIRVRMKVDKYDTPTSKAFCSYQGHKFALAFTTLLPLSPVTTKSTFLPLKFWGLLLFQFHASTYAFTHARLNPI